MAIDILVVDTDRAFGELIRQTLEATGLYRVHAASSGAEALGMAQKHPLRLAILEPERLDVPADVWLRAARKANPRMTVFAIPAATGTLRPPDLEVDGTFPKPFYLPDLPRLVSEAVGLPPEAARPLPFGPPHAGSERQSEPEPEWLSDPSRAQETLTVAVLATPARAAALIRNDRLWALTIPTDSDLKRNQLAPLISTASDVHVRGSLTRFYRPPGQKEDFVAYITPVSRELALVVLFGRETPLGSARRTGETLVYTLRHPTELPPVLPQASPRPAADWTPEEAAVLASVVDLAASPPASPAPPTTPLRTTPVPPRESAPAPEVALFRQSPQPVPTPPPPLPKAEEPEPPSTQPAAPEVVPPPPPVREEKVRVPESPAPGPEPASSQPPPPPAPEEKVRVPESPAPGPEPALSQPPPPPEENVRAPERPAPEPEAPAIQLPRDWVPGGARLSAVASWIESEELAEETAVAVPDDWVPSRPSLPGVEAWTGEGEPAEPPVDLPGDWVPASPMTKDRLPFLEAREPEPPAPAAPVRLPISIVLIPRFPEHLLTRELSDRLPVWISRLCVAWDWTPERIDVRPDRLEVSLVLPPEEAPSHAVQELRDGLAERILRAFPELLPDLPSRRFWASAHLLQGGPPPANREVEDFVHRTRQAQPSPAAFRP